MSKNTLAAWPLALLSAFSLAACSGGGGGSTLAASSGKLNTTDDVAALMSSFNFAAVGFGETLFAAGETMASPAAKQGSLSRHEGFRSKATTTQNCKSGGTKTFTDDTSTAFADDGTRVTASCRDSSSSGSSSYSSTVNGRLISKCTDSAQTSSSCRASTVRMADGASGGGTLDLSLTSTEGSLRTDFEIKLKGDLTESSTDSTETVNLTATLGINDKIDRVTGTAVVENFRSVYTYIPSTGGGNETLSGSFGISSSKSSCSIDKVTIRTDSALTYNSNGNTVAGQLTFTDAANQSARVNFNSDGSVTVTLPNGQTRTYSEAQLDSLC